MAPSVSVPPVSATAATPPISVLGKDSKHQQHMPRSAECQGQQQHDEHEGRGRVQQQFVPRGSLRLGRSAIAQEHSRRKLNFGRDRPARRLGKRGLIGALWRCHHDLAAQPVLVIDQAARQRHVYFGDRGQRRQRSVPPAQQQRAQRLRIGAGVRDAHHHRHAAIRLVEFGRLGCRDKPH